MLFKRRYETLIRTSVEELWKFHASVEALNALTPPEKQAEIVGDDLEVREGAVHKVRVKQYGIAMEWHALIEQVTPPSPLTTHASFVDTALKSPFKTWRHEHRFEPHPDGALLIDNLEYSLPFGPLGAIANFLLVQRDLDKLFAFRHKKTKGLLEKVA